MFRISSLGVHLLAAPPAVAFSLSSSSPPTPAAWGWRPFWTTPPASYQHCGRITDVFGVLLCVSEQAWVGCERAMLSEEDENPRYPSKCDHVANVLAQLLDHDADGSPDDPFVVQAMIKAQSVLVFAVGESEMTEPNGEFKIPPTSRGQDLYYKEVFPNSCMVPSNRGAGSDLDRSTWEGLRHQDSYITENCDNRRDATVEEVFHLITAAAAEVYPKTWGLSFESEVGRELKRLNGNCGWGFRGNWIYPGSPPGGDQTTGPQCEGSLVLLA